MTFKAPQLGDIVDQGGLTSGGELRSAVSTRKAELARIGCKEGSVIALVQPNEASFFVNLFAAWELGACVVPLSPVATNDEIDGILAHSGASLLVRNGKTETLAGKARLPGNALLLYTSGTTGKPKGVRLSYEALQAKLDVLARVQPPEILARTLCLLPVSFGHGLIGIALPTLLAGGELQLQPAFSGTLMAKLGEFLDSHEITFFSTVPSVWSSVLPFAEPPGKNSLRRVFCASAGLPVESWKEAKRWLGGGVDFRNVYGITEAASWISALPEGAAYEKNGEVGPGWGCDFRIENDEVLVKAPYLMTGYHEDEAATRAVLEKGWLRTGDTGVLEAKGLRLLGRLKDQINRGGLKVAPTEVEERLLQHPAVAEACVFAMNDPVTGESVGAAVVAKGAEPSSSELRSYCRQFLSEYKIPEKFFFLTALPRNARGKVSRAEVARAVGVG